MIIKHVNDRLWLHAFNAGRLSLAYLLVVVCTNSTATVQIYETAMYPSLFIWFGYILVLAVWSSHVVVNSVPMASFNFALSWCIGLGCLLESWLLVCSGFHFYHAHRIHFVDFANTHIVVYVLFLILSYVSQVYVTRILMHKLDYVQSEIRSWFMCMDILLYLCLCVVTVRPVQVAIRLFGGPEWDNNNSNNNSAEHDGTLLLGSEIFSWMWVHIIFALFHSTNFYSRHYVYYHDRHNEGFHGCAMCYGSVTQIVTLRILQVVQEFTGRTACNPYKMNE